MPCFDFVYPELLSRVNDSCFYIFLRRTAEFIFKHTVKSCVGGKTAFENTIGNAVMPFVHKHHCLTQSYKTDVSYQVYPAARLEIAGNMALAVSEMLGYLGGRNFIFVVFAYVK